MQDTLEREETEQMDPTAAEMLEAEPAETEPIDAQEAAEPADQAEQTQAEESAAADQAEAVTEPEPENEPEPKPEEENEPDPPAEPTRAEMIRNHYTAIIEANRLIAELRAEEIRAKSAHSAAKKSYESAVEYLSQIISRGPDLQRRLPLSDPQPAPQPDPLLAQPAAANQETAAQAEPQAEPAAQPEPAAEESWRAATIADLGLPHHLDVKIQNAGIETIGQLEDARASEAGLMGLDKIGRASAEKIEEALLDYLKQTRDANAFAGVAEAVADAAAEDEAHAEIDEDQADDDDQAEAYDAEALEVE